MTFVDIQRHAADVHKALAERDVPNAIASFSLLCYARGQLDRRLSDIEFQHARQFARDAQIALSTTLAVRLEGAA